MLSRLSDKRQQELLLLSLIFHIDCVQLNFRSILITIITYPDACRRLMLIRFYTFLRSFRFLDHSSCCLFVVHFCRLDSVHVICLDFLFIDLFISTKFIG